MNFAVSLCLSNALLQDLNISSEHIKLAAAKRGVYTVSIAVLLMCLTAK